MLVIDAIKYNTCINIATGATKNFTVPHIIMKTISYNLQNVVITVKGKTVIYYIPAAMDGNDFAAWCLRHKDFLTKIEGVKTWR